MRWIVERCLAKESRNRYASTEDLARELATIRDHLSEASGAVAMLPAEAAPAPRRGWRIPAILGAGLLAALGFIAWRLHRSDYFWRNPLAGARFARLTDWEGSELDAAVSADGKFVTFLSDRDGPFDAWVTQLGSGEFLNLSKGQFPGLLIDELRNVGFAGDDAHAWIRVGPDRQSVWLVPTMGGKPRPVLAGAAEIAWSPDRTRAAWHPTSPGDPIFVADRNGGNSRQIFIEKPGMHHHYLAWSPDGRFIVYSQSQAGPRYLLKAVTPERQPSPLPKIEVWRAGNRYRFLPNGKALVVMQGQGDGRHQDFWLLDLEGGGSRRLTSLRPGFATKSFDVSPDGKEILFDRFRENSDIVLIDLPTR